MASENSTEIPHVLTPTSNPAVQDNFPSNGGNLISLNASSQIPFKLMKDGGNYSSWKSQMTNLLFGYDLLGFVDGSRLCPPKTDPSYNLWLRQYRLILLAITATVHTAIGPTINNCSTSSSAWNKLESSFANRSNTRRISLLSLLMNLKKGDMTVSEYMNRVKSLIDDLIMIGHPLGEADIMAHTLNAIGDEFKELKAAIRIRDTPISFEDLYDKLLDEEIMQKRDNGMVVEPKITVQHIHKGSNTFNRNKGKASHNNYGQNNHFGQPTSPHTLQQRPPFHSNQSNMTSPSSAPSSASPLSAPSAGSPSVRSSPSTTNRSCTRSLAAIS